MKEERTPLIPFSTGYQKINEFSIKHSDTNKDARTASNSDNTIYEDVEKVMIYNQDTASCRSEHGTYRRMYHHATSSGESSEEDDDHWTSPSRKVNRIHNATCRCFLFCIIVIFFLFLLYVPAYNNVVFRPDSLLRAQIERKEKIQRLLSSAYDTGEGTVVGWSYNKSRNTRTYVLPDNVTVLNQPKQFCKHSTPGPPSNEPEIFLLVIITSSLSHFDRRMAIRETWGNESNYKFLAKRMQKVADVFVNVNMTDSLFVELGYWSNNVSVENRKERNKRFALDDEYIVKDRELPREERKQIEWAESLDGDLRLSKYDGANSSRGNEALLESLTNDISRYNLLGSTEPNTNSIYKHLDRKLSSDHLINLDSVYKPYRQRREVISDKKESGKTESIDYGEKRAIYDDGDVVVDESMLGNFETTDPEQPQDYDYHTEESNVMRIPRRGGQSEPDESLKKALQDIKNSLQLSFKDGRLSLKYVTSKDKGKQGSESKQSLDSKGSNPRAKEHFTKKSNTEQKEQDLVKTKYLFLLGQSGDNDTDLQAKIDEEAATYGDIVQEGFIDSYNNLTLKSVMLLKWVISNCGDNVHYIMKTDDDMFINIPRLVEALKNQSEKFISNESNAPSHTHQSPYTKEKLLMGDLICDARPISDMRSKWYSPSYMYSGKVYPTYLSGVGYVMSMGAARDLYHAALDTPLFHLEDVFITGMCSHSAGIKPQDHPGFSYVVRKFNLCVYANMITSHQVTPSQMKVMFSKFTSNNTYPLVVCEAIRLRDKYRESALSPSQRSIFAGKDFLGSPRNIITGLTGFGSSDARKRKLKKANNGCS